MLGHPSRSLCLSLFFPLCRLIYTAKPPKNPLISLTRSTYHHPHLRPHPRSRLAISRCVRTFNFAYGNHDASRPSKPPFRVQEINVTGPSAQTFCSGRKTVCYHYLQSCPPLHAYTFNHLTVRLLARVS